MKNKIFLWIPITVIAVSLAALVIDFLTHKFPQFWTIIQILIEILIIFLLLYGVRWLYKRNEMQPPDAVNHNSTDRPAELRHSSSYSSVQSGGEMPKFQTLTFPNTHQGQKEKVYALARYTDEGWHIVSETITPGKFQGKDACCLSLICLPLGFLAGHDVDKITVTMQREETPTAPDTE